MRDYSIGGNLYDDYYSSLGGIEEIDPYGAQSFEPEPVPSFERPEPEPEMDLYESKDPLISHEGIGFDDPGMEQDFQNWYRSKAEPWKLNPDPDAEEQQYDYRAAYLAGDEPDQTGHWPSKHKFADHPNRYVDGVDTITGEPAPATAPARAVSPYTPEPPVQGDMEETPDFSAASIYGRAVDDINKAYPADYVEKQENPLRTAVSAIPRMIGYLPEIGKWLSGRPTYGELAGQRGITNSSMGMEGTGQGGNDFLDWMTGETQRRYLYEKARSSALKTRLGIEDLTSKIGAREGNLWVATEGNAREEELHPYKMEEIQQKNQWRPRLNMGTMNLNRAKEGQARAGARLSDTRTRGLEYDYGERPMMPSGPKYEVTLGNALDNQDKTMSLAEKYARHGLPRGIGSEAIREYMPQIGSPAARGIEAETQSLEAEPGLKHSQAAENVVNTARGEQDLLLTPEMHAARIRQMAEDSALAKAKALGLSQQYWMQPEKFKAEMGKLRLEAAGQALENAQKEFEILNQSDVLASQQAKDRAAVALSEARRFYIELQAEYFPEITETNLAGERADTRGTNATTDLTHARTTATVQGTQQRAQSFPLEQDARRQGLDQGALNLSQADAKFVTETYGKVFDSYMDVRSKTLGTRGWIGQREVDSLTMEQLAPSEGFFWSRDSQGNIRDGSPIDIDNPDLDSFRRSAGKWAAMQPGIPELKEKDPGAAAAYVAQQIRRLADLWRGKRYTQPRLPPP